MANEESHIIKCSKNVYTIELGYNDHGYNEQNRPL